MTARYVIGIDLGTTNSLLAYAELDSEQPQVQLLAIPQLVDAGTVEARESLPSFAYLATEAESQTGTLDLPWNERRSYAVGIFARRRSAEAPQRTISAAKSWLCHSRVDRRQAVLPWNAPADVPKISPVTASQRYLQHLADAWHAAFPDTALTDQKVVLTVPASFDPVARELTREAALAAGLPSDLALLEEPQAALYAWLVRRGDEWRKRLRVGETILVCDVGGGTTDLTLIRVDDEAGELSLRRVAVGGHLLVGGDNMDLALAHFVAQQFAEKRKLQLDPWQSVALWHSCRDAKEALLAADGKATIPLSVLGRGSKLVGGTVSIDVAREDAVRLLVDGFFPTCQRQDRPQTQRASGFQQLGLLYESDPAITRHVAAFLADHEVDNESRLPTHVLFNGGVFQAPALRERFMQVLSDWSGKQPAPRVLDGEADLDQAVARGAAYYGWSKQQGGVRIRGGVARSYYVGIETAGLAIPGAPRPLQALCVVPFGMEEGTDVDVPSSNIGLVLDEPARFRFFGSTIRKQDQPGDVLARWSDDELIETTSLETTLAKQAGEEDNYVPIRFRSHITELGVFELWCVSQRSDARWKLEFSVRDEAKGSGA